MRNMKGKYKRFHTLLPDGSYHIINVLNGVEPPPDYYPGCPKFSPELRERTKIGLQQSGHGRGSKKSQLQRLRMSAAKVNVPKDVEHRNNMSAAHLEKNRLVKEYLELHPELKYREAYKIVTQIQGRVNRTVRSKRLYEMLLPQDK